MKEKNRGRKAEKGKKPAKRFFQDRSVSQKSFKNKLKKESYRNGRLVPCQMKKEGLSGEEKPV